MQASALAKYGFRIRTRGGAVVDNLLIYGRDEQDAERKLRQIYIACEILEARLLPAQPSHAAARYEDVVDLISGATV